MSPFRFSYDYGLSICLQSWYLVIHLYIYNWTCCINQIPVLNGAFHGARIRPDATRQQLYLLASCLNKPHLKPTTLTFCIRCLQQTTTGRVRKFSTMISLLSQHQLHVAGQMNQLIYTATALRRRSCKKFKEPPPHWTKGLFPLPLVSAWKQYEPNAQWRGH